MHQTSPLTRREALRSAALGVLTLPLAATGLRAAEKKEKKEKQPAAAPALPSYTTFPGGRENGLRLGIASYSLRNLPLDEAIAVVKVMRISNIALFRLHCNWEAAPVENAGRWGPSCRRRDSP